VTEIRTLSDGARQQLKSNAQVFQAFKKIVGRRAPAQDALRQDPPRTIKKMTDREPRTRPTTIDDPAILDEIGSAIKAKGSA
jgi:hypothetical protein